MNQNHFEHNSNYSSFDQPSQYPIDHQEYLNQQRISDVHVRWDKIEESQNELLKMMQSFCEMVIQQKQAANIDQSPPQEMSIQEMEDLKQQYLDEMQRISNQIQIKDYQNEKINIRFRKECEITIDELKGKFNGMSIEINKKKELRQQEQAANVSTYTPEPSRRFNIIYDYDDDDDDDENCDNSVTLSNPLFDSNNDFTSSDDESLSDEDVPEDNRTSESEDSYVSKLDEPDLIVTPLSAFNKDECFDPGGDIDEIDAFLDIVVSSDFEDDY
ncbi:hypothetical protein Tco_0052635 [Tanacetum coccineum]